MGPATTSEMGPARTRRNFERERDSERDGFRAAGYAKMQKKRVKE